jgi:hypothetical protein
VNDFGIMSPLPGLGVLLVVVSTKRPLLTELVRRAGSRVCVADFRGVLVITKKVFFDPLKNTGFLQFFKSD